MDGTGWPCCPLVGPDVDGLEVRHDLLRLPADIGRRIEVRFYLLAGHLLQSLQRDDFSPISCHDAIYCAVTNTVAIAAS